MHVPPTGAQIPQLSLQQKSPFWQWFFPQAAIVGTPPRTRAIEIGSIGARFGAFAGIATARARVGTRSSLDDPDASSVMLRSGSSGAGLGTSAVGSLELHATSKSTMDPRASVITSSFHMGSLPARRDKVRLGPVNVKTRRMRLGPMLYRRAGPRARPVDDSSGRQFFAAVLLAFLVCFASFSSTSMSAMR